MFKRVAVLMGGPSAERDISLRSGMAARRGLQESGYEAEAVEITGRTFTLPPGTDAVFIALHGEFGEDGQVQAILDRMRVPYTGSGAVASRLAMDKLATKQALEAKGIPTPDYRVVRQGERPDFPLPAVVKPARQGSSFGVHLVKEPSQMMAALEDAFRYDDEVLVEAYIAGRELTVGVIDREALPLVEIAAPDGWYGYEAKYKSDKTRYICPAEISDPVKAQAQLLALMAFDELGCEGVGRVDFRLSPEDKLYVLELNSIPGLTETSLLPKAAAAAGISFAALCARLMCSARCSDGGEEAES